MTLLDDKNSSENNNISDLSLQYIKSSSGWMKFCAVAGIIFGCFAILGALAMLNNATSDTYPPQIINVMYALAVLYFIFGGLYIYTSITLFQYANLLTNFAASSDMNTLEAGLKKQKHYWIMSGVFIISIVVLLIVLVAVSINGQAPIR